MRELKLSDIGPVQDVTNKIWVAFDILRGQMSSSDLHIVFFLISIYKDGLFETFNNAPIHHSKEELRRSIHQCEDYRHIFDSYLSIFDSISNDRLYEINQVFRSLDHRILAENFDVIFDDLLYKLSVSQGRGTGEFIQPIEITRFALNLVDLPRNARVYNPFAGMASFGVFLPEGHHYIGQELNRNTWALGALRMMAHHRGGESHFVCEDSVDRWIEHEKHDLIIATPPFNMRIGNNNRWRHEGIRNVEQFILSHGLRSLKAEGKMVLVLPMGVLFRSELQHIRRELVENDILDIIVSLPSGLLSNTGISLCILVINKAKQRNGIVRIVDATDFVKEESARDRKLNDYKLNSIIKKVESNDSIRFVEVGKIRELDYNFNVPLYFSKEYQGVKLSELCEVIRGRAVTNEESGKPVKIRDLKEDRIDNLLDVSGIEVAKNNRPLRAISESCILVALRWRKLNPTFFKYDGESIYIRPDLLAIKVDESKIDPQYLINEFYSDYISEQLNIFRVGEVMPFIRKEDFLSIKIDLPPIHEQRKKVGLEVAKKMATLQEERNKLAHEYNVEKFNEFASLKHSLGAPRQNILSNSKTLISFFEKQKSDEFLKLNSEFEKQFDISLVDVFKEIRNDINHISVMLDKGEDGLVVENYGLEVVSIDQIIRLVKSLSDKNHNFSFDRFFAVSNNMKKRGIVCNITLFKVLLDNILSNASKYGFTTKSKTNVVVIDLIEEQDNLVLNVKNNGIPFSKNFTQEKFITKYSTADKSKGTGIGGYDIDRIAKYFGDEKWSLLLDDFVYPVWFVFSFPIKSVE